MSKQRVDILMVERDLAETREKAKRMVMAGIVYSQEHRLDKPGMKVSADIPLTVKGNPLPYVGRGGLKLEKALREFHIFVKNKIMLDVGSSTGGFTDCALQHGARQCYAVDVGNNQLAWKLRNDSRVVVMERTNFRYVTPDTFPRDTIDFATVDVSFISLELILPVLKRLLASESTVIVLIKPQFEADKEDVGKKGIVRDEQVHVNVLQKVLAYACELGYSLHGLTFSPVTGGDGNVEFLAYLGWKHSKESVEYTEAQLRKIIQNARDELHKK